MTHLYKVALGWLCKAKTVTDNMEAVWTAVLSIKDVILNLLETDNDGMRTHAIKFMEMLVITQTHAEGENAGKDLSLDDVPLTLKIARPRKLEEEAMQVQSLRNICLISPYVLRHFFGLRCNRTFWSYIVSALC